MRRASLFLVLVLCATAALGQASLTISDAIPVDEGDSGTVQLDFEVKLSTSIFRRAGALATLSVTFSTTDGSATEADNDYEFKTGVLTFDGTVDETQTISILVNGDMTVEADEIFFVDISAPGVTIPPGQARGQGTIRNDDSTELSIDNVTVTEGDASTVDAVFTVSLSNPSDSPVGVDFTARDGSATTADNDYGLTPGTLTFNPGELTQTVTAKVNGDTKVEADENFFVDLTNPSGATIADGEGEGTISNDDSTELSIDDVAVTEGDAGTVNAVFTVSLSKASGVPVSVDFATRNGSATIADSDYTTAAGTLSFGAGQLTQTVPVAVKGDTKVEADENFFVDLTNPSGATIADGEGEGTISNDDSAALSIDDVAVTEGDAGTVNAVFTVSLSNPSGVPVSVDFATRNGSATIADRDYRAASGSLSFGPGQISQALTVAVNGDTKVESDESFFVDLSNPAGATIADGTGKGAITNDDSTALSIDNVKVTEGDAGAVSAVFTVSLSNPSALAVSVDFVTRNGSATLADGDYRAKAGTLSLSPGQLTVPVTVFVNSDTAVEPDETFFVDLSRPSGAVIADARGIATILNDDTEPGEIRLVQARATEEGAGRAVIRARRTGNPAGPAQVTIRARSGTAKAGEDFTAASERLTWNAGELGTKRFEVEILDDNLLEDDETVVIRLSDPAGARLGIPSELELVILDDDDPALLEAVGETEVTAKVGEETELQVRASRLDGAPVQGATVLWEVEGNAELATGETSQTDADGITGQRIQLGELPGRVTVRARLAQPDGARVANSPATAQLDHEVVFEITVEGDLDALFDGQNNPAESSVADVLNQACGEEQENLADLCSYLFGLDPADQRSVIRELIPRAAATQGDFSLSSLLVQLRNIISRLAELRGGATGQATNQLALQIHGRAVPVALIQAALRHLGRSQGRFLARVDSALASSLQLSGSEEAASGDKIDIDAPSKWGFFVNGRISMGDRPATTREEGLEFETQGLTTGVDYRLSKRFVVGGALGYLAIDTDLDRNGGLDVQGYSLSAYTTYFVKGFYVDGVLSYGRNEYEVVRNIDLPQPFGGISRLEARAEPTGKQMSAAVNVGYDAALGAVSIGGFGRLSWIDGEVDGYAERGAGPFNLVIGNQDVQSLLLEAGVEVTRAASYSWGVLQPTLRASALHEFEDDSRLIRGRFVEDLNANEFVLPTDRPDRDYFNLGLGLTATLPRGRAVYIFYDTDLEREDLDIYTFSIGLRIAL